MKRAQVVVFEKVLAIFLAALALFLIGGVPSRAIEAPRVYRGVLILEGKIVPGDYDRLRKFLAVKSTFDKISGGVFVASPGGDLVEAVKIGRLIRALRLSTVAPSGSANGGRRLGESPVRPENLHQPNDYLCASACFLIFVSGIYRDLNWAGLLGIHGPTVTKSDLKKFTDSEQAFYIGRVRHAVDDYLRAMNVRIKYVDLMFSIPSTEVHWITQQELDADLQGFIPELKDQAAARCADRTTVSPSEKTAAVAKAPAEIAGCEAKVLAQMRAELPAEGWQKVFGGR